MVVRWCAGLTFAGIFRNPGKPKEDSGVRCRDFSSGPFDHLPVGVGAQEKEGRGGEGKERRKEEGEKRGGSVNIEPMLGHHIGT